MRNVSSAICAIGIAYFGFHWQSILLVIGFLFFWEYPVKENVELVRTQIENIKQSTENTKWQTELSKAQVKVNLNTLQIQEGMKSRMRRT